MQIETAIAVIILFVLSFLATIDMAFGQLSDVSLRRLTSDEDEKTNLKLTLFLKQIIADRPRFRFTLSATIQILLIIFSILVTLIVYHFYQTHIELLSVSLIIGLIFPAVFRQFLPRFITRNNPDKFIISLLPYVRPFYKFLSFLADPFELFSRENQIETTITPNKDGDSSEEDTNDDDNLQALIDIGEAEGILEEDEREMIETMVEFGDTIVSEIMMPRTEIVSLSLDSTIEQARDLMIDSKCSRIPIFHENIDDIKGILFMRDLLSVWADAKQDPRIERLLRPTFFIPETKPVNDLLKEMQKAHVQLAIVIDEYGGVAGLVTVEDILEELVGEIEDEDTEKEEVIEIIEGGGGSYFDVIGSTEIGKIERLFDLEIEDDDFTTIAGLVTSEIGRIPTIGENLNFRGLDVEILQADEKKISLLRIKKESLELVKAEN